MLYPALDPCASSLLALGHGHRVFREQYGNAQGQPFVFLHGGPGGGCTPRSRHFFNPDHHRVALFDQRDCGRAARCANTKHNFFESWVYNMDTQREALGIGRWWLFGGAWGPTLARSNTRHHRARVQGLVLGGVLGAQPHELDWLYKPDAASQIFAKAWHAYATALGSMDPQQMLLADDQQLHRNDPAQAQAAALAWCGSEDAISFAHTAPRRDALDPPHSLAKARISTHLSLRDPRPEASGQLWPAQNLQGFRGTNVQDHWDVVTPAVTAWQLRQGWPNSTLRNVPEAGPASSDPALRQALIKSVIKALPVRADRAEMTMNEAEISNFI